MTIPNVSKSESIKQSLKETMERRKHQRCCVYKIKVDESKLSKKQQEQLKMVFVESKWLYNHILNWSKEHDLKCFDTKIKTVLVKNKDGVFETRELKIIGSQIKQSILEGIWSTIKTLSTLKKRGNKVGRLKFLSDYKSINLKQFNLTYKIWNNKYLKIQNISGKIKVNGLDQFINIPDIEIANAKILNQPDGYFIAITVFRNTDSLEKPNYIGKEIGIDMGIKDSIVLSNGEKFKASIEETERLKRLQKKLSRQKKGSNNRFKIIIKIKKEYQKITNRKNDISNKLVSHILSFENVYMQDEQLHNWQKGLFGKQVQHSILGRVKMKLTSHPRVDILNRFVPTTKFCPICQNIKKDLSLKDRVYVCDYCGYHEDRDIHSAKNMITMTKIIKYNLPREPREVKPVETSTSVSRRSEISAVSEAGSQ